MEFVIRIDNPAFTTGVKSPVKVDVIINFKNYFLKLFIKTGQKIIVYSIKL